MPVVANTKNEKAIKQVPAEQNIVTADLDEKAYQLAIENLAATRNTAKFDNKGSIHASIVFGNMFKTAETDVKIYTGSLSGEVSDLKYYQDNMKSLLQRDIPVSIIFQNEPNWNSCTLSLFKEYPKNNISLWRLNDASNGFFPNHFAIADKRMYRFETSTENFMATCSFNNPLVAEKLDTVFTYMLTSMVTRVTDADLLPPA